MAGIILKKRGGEIPPYRGYDPQTGTYSSTLYLRAGPTVSAIVKSTVETIFRERQQKP